MECMRRTASLTLLPWSSGACGFTSRKSSAAIRASCVTLSALSIRGSFGMFSMRWIIDPGVHSFTSRPRLSSAGLPVNGSMTVSISPMYCACSLERGTTTDVGLPPFSLGTSRPVPSALAWAAKSSCVTTSAKERYMRISSGMFVNFAKRALSL
ncbi:Uncharacterised protein [Salmonella enterica]|uniref:Uncharacterized protein n=1 Tax=Salmonella enterica TaxID=28901 RepID=A0A379QHT6_SALER|nr:Uncharacterised protein [Salmonella enterica]